MANTLTLVITTAVMLLFISDSYAEDCYNQNPHNYDGTKSTTHDGTVCQRWDAMTPHIVQAIYRKFPKNYCRSAPAMGFEPWCYTTGDKRWDYCGVEKCVTDKKCFEELPWEYDGNVHTTQHGVECQRWDSSGKPRFVAWIYRHHQENYCRSAKGSNFDPWCYTTSGSETWDYCDVRKCGAPPRPKQKEDCFVGVPSDYDGTRSTTWRGETCQEWSTNSPRTIYHKYSKLPKNYCRTLKGEEHYKPWCYIADKNSVQEWGYCGIDVCVDIFL